ncbi:ABC transporter permease [Sediminibacterium sp. TEGAF015]|uniref:ABC transporter permease n=1 Tax=Sediminibacterium sp. TEGAF015 TaxID=575378 RepID=UPI0021F9752A|nr:FtsX-like permease family protein [Sediminibacterium sp. TEGAF015]BDQ11019.1 permease [Sediminibacterium sp. TEGAF015]
MNFPAYIAQKLAANQKQTFSRFIIRLSVGATAVGVAAMIITICFVNGFQQTVAQKVFNFWGHIRVQHFEPDKSLMAEELPISRNKEIEALLNNQKSILRHQAFATKSAVISYKKNIEGILLKGVESTYDSTLIKPFITEGKWLKFSDSVYSREIIVSKQIAGLLNIHINDTVTIYFVGNESTQTTYRKLKVAGLYKTGIEEYDKLFMLTDLRLIARLNQWEPDQIGGYEIFLNEGFQPDSANQVLQNDLPTEWMSRTVASIYPNIFDWLQIQNMNRDVIFIIMAIVAIINLVTCLLILILERTPMIGILKALGARDRQIIQIFLHHAGNIALKGVIWGFAVGMGLVLLQQSTGFIKLDESAYYVKEAPVLIVWWQIVLVCMATWLLSFIILLLPALLVKKIKPIEAIQFR